MYEAQGKVPLPENYDMAIDQNGAVGLNYRGKRGIENIIPIVCTDLACFKCMGKILIVYSSPILNGMSKYSVQNRKGNLVVKVPVYDFFASTQFMYILTNSPQGNMEWAKLNTDLTIEKFVGVFTLNDYAVKDGTRVISGNGREGMDVLDRHGKPARITFRTGVLEDVITFSTSSKTSRVFNTVAETVKPQKFSLDLNITTGDIQASYNNGENLRIGNLPGIENIMSTINSIMKGFNTTREEVTKQVTSGRKECTQVCVKYNNIGVDEGKKLVQIFKSLELYGYGDFLIMLSATMHQGLSGKELLNKIHADVCLGYTDINDKYSFKMILCYELAVLVVKQNESGRVHIETINWEEKDKKRFGELPDIAKTVRGITGSTVIVANMNVSKLSKEKIAEFGKIPKSLSAVGSAKRGKVSINNSNYREGYSVAAGMKVDNKLLILAFHIFGGFSYDNYSLKESQKGVQLGKAAIHNKKYNDNNFVLNTKTNGFTVCVSGGAASENEEKAS